MWTDAFAVCNFLSLYRQTGEDRYLALAVELVDQVRHIWAGTGKTTRGKDGSADYKRRKESITPRAGGLRIGKTLNQRETAEPPDARLEWDQDGQYFHYLTKWMHALYRIGRETGDDRYLRWAAELAVTAHS